MKKLLTLTLILVLSCTALAAQERTVTVNTSWKEDKSLELSFKVTKPGTHTVFVAFRDMRNTREPRMIIHEISTNGFFYIIKPINKEENISYSAMLYTSLHGRFNPPVDSSFVYNLPFPAERKFTAHNMHDLWEKHFKEEDRDPMHAYQFIMEAGDTIAAMRKGIVTEIHDGKLPVDDYTEISFSSNYNFLKIEHADGSIASYKVLQNGSFMVKEGDTVYPGTPLALAGTYDNQIYQSRISVYCYQQKSENKYLNIENIRNNVRRSYMEPIFATSEGNLKLENEKTYTAVLDSNIITREMSKRELKNYQKTKNK